MLSLARCSSDRWPSAPLMATRIETIRAIRQFVKAGGTVVALEELPSAAAGLKNCEANDKELKEIVSGLFGANSAVKANAVFLPEYKLARTPFNPMRQPYSKTAPLTEPQAQFLAGPNPDVYIHGRKRPPEMDETDLPPSGLIGPVQIKWQTMR